MSDVISWAAIIIGSVFVVMILEVLLRTMINRRGESPDPMA